jgi:hypothetical protein
VKKKKEQDARQTGIFLVSGVPGPLSRSTASSKSGEGFGEHC